MSYQLVPVLALDLATRTGWAWRGRSGAIRSGARQLTAKSPGLRLREAEEFFPSLLARIAWGTGELVYERPVTRRGRNAIRVACHLEAMVLLAAESYQIPAERIHQFGPKEVKKHVAGSGNASKDEVLAAVNERFGLELNDYDQADALGLLDLFLARKAA